MRGKPLNVVKVSWVRTRFLRLTFVWLDVLACLLLCNHRHRQAMTEEEDSRERRCTLAEWRGGAAKKNPTSWTVRERRRRRQKATTSNTNSLQKIIVSDGRHVVNVRWNHFWNFFWFLYDWKRKLTACSNDWTFTTMQSNVLSKNQVKLLITLSFNIFTLQVLFSGCQKFKLCCYMITLVLM